MGRFNSADASSRHGSSVFRSILARFLMDAAETPVRPRTSPRNPRISSTPVPLLQPRPTTRFRGRRIRQSTPGGGILSETQIPGEPFGRSLSPCLSSSGHQTILPRPARLFLRRPSGSNTHRLSSSRIARAVRASIDGFSISRLNSLAIRSIDGLPSTSDAVVMTA